MTLLMDFMILNIFLGLGWFVREKFTVLQRIFMPSSVVGGIMLLICGPQVLNIVPISPMIGKYPNFLIDIILTCLVFGTRFDRKRARSYMDYTLVAAGTYGAQMFFGVGISFLLSKIWTSMPPNWGIRKGYCEFVDKPEKLPPDYYGGPMPPEKQTPIGTVKTSTAGINAIALQMFFISLCMMLGYVLRLAGVTYISPYFKNVNDLVLGIIGAIIIWPIMCKTGADVYVDKKTCSNISGFCLEYLIVSAVGTISVSAMVSFIIPITIYCVLMLAILTFLYVWMSAKICKEQWFEKMVVVFGQCIGNAATGLTLLRCIDPKNESCAGDAGGMGLFLFMPIWVGMIAIGPELAVLENGTNMLLAFGAGLMAVCYGIGLLFMNTHRKIF